MKLFLLGFCVVGLVACETTMKKGERPKAKRKYRTEKINRERCSFDLSNKLALDDIDSTQDPEGYFKISSSVSDNIMQVFVFDVSIDVDDKLENMQKALNTPDIYTASTIDKIDRLGSYTGKGVDMEGVYNGGIVVGNIKIFCYGKEGKGFMVVRQTITTTDTSEFNQVENSFQLK